MEVINGYPCKTCTDVEYAKKGVDPAHPKEGPQGAYAVGKAEEPGSPRGPAVTFGGGLTPPEASPTRAAPYVPGANLSLTA